MIPRDSQTGKVLVNHIPPRRAAVLCWLIDHYVSLAKGPNAELPNHSLRKNFEALPRKLERQLEAGLKDAGFYALNNQSISVSIRVDEAFRVYRCGLRARTQLRRRAAGYKPPYA